MLDPVTYTVEISHWQDGEIDVTVKDIGSSDDDKKAIIAALEKAIEVVKKGEVAQWN
jgi:hypothetical protein